MPPWIHSGTGRRRPTVQGIQRFWLSSLGAGAATPDGSRGTEPGLPAVSLGAGAATPDGSRVPAREISLGLGAATPDGARGSTCGTVPDDGPRRAGMSIGDFEVRAQHVLQRDGGRARTETRKMSTAFWQRGEGRKALCPLSCTFCLAERLVEGKCSTRMHGAAA